MTPVSQRARRGIILHGVGLPGAQSSRIAANVKPK